MSLIDPGIEQYAEQHTTPEPELLQELVEVSYEELAHIDMFSGPVVGRLLNMLVAISGAKRVLEIGTFTGYSALMMAGALPDDGELITCDLNERYMKLARRFFEKSEHGHKITLMEGEALTTLKRLEGPFDLAFIDADKANYPAYYEAIRPMLPGGALMVIDNVFWEGKVLDPQDVKTRSIDELNKKIAADSSVEQVMLTVRDGLLVVRKL